MIRKISLILLLSLFFVISVFAQDYDSLFDVKIPEFRSIAYIAVVVPGEEGQIPGILRSNEFFLESVRLTRLAEETFDYGDYDASASFAAEAIRYAELSDEYVAINLISEARRLLDWADSNEMAVRYPYAYNEGRGYYEASVTALFEEEYMDSIHAAVNSIEILAALESGRVAPLPRQYTVRTWAVERDCLWNIAGYPWVYNDPWKWVELYNANLSRMPEQDNPDLIHPGMILDIPSIRGEDRQGMWDSSRIYERF